MTQTLACTGDPPALLSLSHGKHTKKKIPLRGHFRLAGHTLPVFALHGLKVPGCASHGGGRPVEAYFWIVRSSGLDCGDFRVPRLIADHPPPEICKRFL